jgi:cytochrome c556
MKHLVAGVAFAALSTVPFAAHAQFAKAEDAVRYRHAAFTLMGAHMGRIGAVVKGAQPYDKAAVEKDAAILEMLSKLPWSAFPPGSDTEHSKAKPEVWKEQDKFKAAAEKMEGEVVKLSTAAKSGDLTAVKTAFGAVGQSCKSCHDSFRNK